MKGSATATPPSNEVPRTAVARKRGFISSPPKQRVQRVLVASLLGAARSGDAAVAVQPSCLAVMFVTSNIFGGLCLLGSAATGGAGAPSWGCLPRATCLETFPPAPWTPNLGHIGLHRSTSRLSSPAPRLQNARSSTA